MQKVGVVASIIVITFVFIYSMIYVSDINRCSGVRVYECKKEENKNSVSKDKYNELKKTGDIFLKNCKPIIKENENIYILDYSSCNLHLEINKEKPWVESVYINGFNLTREEINSNF